MLVRRHIQQQRRVSSDATAPDLEHLVCRADLAVFSGMVEPTVPGRSVDLGGIPCQRAGIALQRLSGTQIIGIGAYDSGKTPVIAMLRFRCRQFRRTQRLRNDAPFIGSGMPRLVAAPPYIRATDADDGFGLQGSDHVVVTLPVIGLLTSIRTFAAGAVEPYREDRPVMGEQLDELANIKIVICLALTVGALGAIPGER